LHYVAPFNEMLIIANGAFKSGSTWLRDIVLEIVESDELPAKFGMKRRSHWVDPNKLDKLLADDVCQDRVFVSKAHMYDTKHRDLLLSSKQAKVLNIRRDIRDVIVSAYYHSKRQGKYRGNFFMYYWLFGRYKAFQINRYHEVWNVRSPYVLTTSFEMLKTEFQSEVGKIGSFLGKSLQAYEIDQIKEETTLEKLREKRGESELEESKRFFRKGEVGGWSNYFDEAMLADVSRIEEHGLGRIEYLVYLILFDLRLRLVNTFRSIS
jgi:hypothetical protein